MPIDLKDALNAISDIVNNRPLPLREFDQIYMKVGDMVQHAEYVARRFDKKDLVFVGDGDAVGLSVMHLAAQGVLGYGPSSLTVLDFDERMVNSITRFAEHFGYEQRIQAIRYNVIDELPPELLGRFGAFHINPPWGQHNEGESVVVFLQRAIQLLELNGSGIIVIADDAARAWTNQVLRRTQQAALDHGCIVETMIPGRHSYHLDDAPDLRSCTLGIRKVHPDQIANDRLRGERLENFYGRDGTLRVHYVREIPDVAPGRADDRTYEMVPLDGAYGVGA